MTSITLTFKENLDKGLSDTLARMAYYVENGRGFVQDYETAILGTIILTHQKTALYIEKKALQLSRALY